MKFDLTLVSHMSYYTGILFEVYADQVGFPIASGGRYDLLLKKFGKDTGATGYAIRLDRLLEALGKMESKEPVQCILFSSERRKEAIVLATQKRKEGIKVVLQDINGVTDIDACTKVYNEVCDASWKRREGASAMKEPLIFAMPKGRIFEEAAALLREAGFSCRRNLMIHGN